MLTSFTLLVSMYHLNIIKKISDSKSHWINQFRVFKPCLGQFFLFYFLSVFLCVGMSLDCLVSSQTTICLERVFGLDPSLITQPKNHMLFPLSTRLHHPKKKSPQIDFLLASFFGLDPSTLDGADMQMMIGGFGPQWFGEFLRCKPIAFDTLVQMGKPGPLLVQTLGLGDVNTSTYPFYWADLWTGPDQPSW